MAEKLLCYFVWFWAYVRREYQWLIPKTEKSLRTSGLYMFLFLLQKNFSAGINSEVHYKPRIPAARGRSTVPRGRGRGRGEGYSRSLSQNDDAISSFSRLGPKDYSRRESWDEKAITRNGINFLPINLSSLVLICKTSWNILNSGFESIIHKRKCK